MSKIEIKKTELVWRGKYDEEGKLVPVEKPGPYPFQIVESINAVLIHQGLSQSQRLQQLNQIAISQMKSLIGNINFKKLK